MTMMSDILFDIVSFILIFGSTGILILGIVLWGFSELFPDKENKDE